MTVARRLLRSAAYRSSALYRRTALALPLPKPRVRPAPEMMELTYLTLSGQRHLEMLRESLLSLCRSWPRLPRLRVVSDGTVDLQQARAALGWWPGPWELLPWDHVLAGLDGQGSLARFAQRDAMGRKMAAVVTSAAEGPTLYCDVDLLWFRVPPTLEGLLAESSPRLVMSPDYQPSYDPELVPGTLPGLASPPFFCAGFLFAAGRFLDACDVGPLLDYAAERGIGVTEQTILAEADRQLGARTWPAGEIALDETDRFSLAPSFKGRTWAARHYVGQVRHLFWRDALALRLGLGPGAER